MNAQSRQRTEFSGERTIDLSSLEPPPPALSLSLSLSLQLQSVAARARLGTGRRLREEKVRPAGLAARHTEVVPGARSVLHRATADAIQVQAAQLLAEATLVSGNTSQCHDRSSVVCLA